MYNVRANCNMFSATQRRHGQCNMITSCKNFCERTFFIGYIRDWDFAARQQKNGQ